VINKRTFIALTVIVLATIILAGCSLLQGEEEPSEPISAIPVVTTEVESETSAATNDGEDAEESAAEGETAIATVFQLVQDESEARFTIGETLRGQQTEAVGATNQVAAEIALDFDDPTATQLGIVQVDARTIETDQDRRNRAIGRFILNTGDFEFITFAPTTISGLPETTSFGESYSFQITGDLTIRDVTNEATFDATVTPVSEDRLEGSATTTVNRGDFDLNIPSVPFVADVAEDVLLEIEFVATLAASTS
jgi:polyisoprenoid-binding protein YceI